MSSQYSDRIAELAADAERARESFDPPTEPPDEARAMRFCREGVGEAVAVYVDARSGEWDRFGEAEFDRLERALNDYLELYARCYGVELDAEYSVRTAAEALIDTHNVADVARILTSVPDRSDGR
ncbi:hypothetical protein [Halosimplex sp. J119]